MLSSSQSVDSLLIEQKSLPPVAALSALQGLVVLAKNQWTLSEETKADVIVSLLATRRYFVTASEYDSEEARELKHTIQKALKVEPAVIAAELYGLVSKCQMSGNRKAGALLAKAVERTRFLTEDYTDRALDNVVTSKGFLCCGCCGLFYKNTRATQIALRDKYRDTELSLSHHLITLKQSYDAFIQFKAEVAARIEELKSQLPSLVTFREKTVGCDKQLVSQVKRRTIELTASARKQGFQFFLALTKEAQAEAKTEEADAEWEHVVAQDVVPAEEDAVLLPGMTETDSADALPSPSDPSRPSGFPLRRSAFSHLEQQMLRGSTEDLTALYGQWDQEHAQACAREDTEAPTHSFTGVVVGS